jgi:LmbE family N-acetylglucosaminyl deacetylase
VLVLAPHADDEVIGLGGTLALHAMARDPIQVVIAFDGALGLPAGKDPELRRREAIAGGRHLGALEYVFWDYPEGHEPTASELEGAVSRLEQHLRAQAAEIVYAPWIGEQHVDHHVLSRVARRALAACSWPGEAWGYEVWTPLEPTRVIDVSGVWDRKLAALAEHESQLARADLVHASCGLAAHRSLYLAGDSRYGEAFCPLLDGPGGTR